MVKKERSLTFKIVLKAILKIKFWGEKKDSTVWYSLNPYNGIKCASAQYMAIEAEYCMININYEAFQELRSKTWEWAWPNPAAWKMKAEFPLVRGQSGIMSSRLAWIQSETFSKAYEYIN